jgi:hypothetical protein
VPAFQLNGNYYDPALAQLGDGVTPATAYGLAEGKWRTNIYKLFPDLIAHVANLITSSINGSNIFGHEVPSSATTITLTNASKRSQGVTMTATGQAVRMPNATTITKGEAWRIRNVGSNAFALQDNATGVIVPAVVPGDEIHLWCEANGTAAGTWRVKRPTLAPRLATKTASYAFSAHESGKLIPVDASAGAWTQTLPLASAVGAGFTIGFQKVDNSFNPVTFARSGSDLINGTTARQLSALYDTFWLTSDGVSNWYLFGETFHRGGWELIDKQVAASSSFLGFTKGINQAVADEYMMVIHDLYPSVTQGDFFFQASKDGGTTWLYPGTWKGHDSEHKSITAAYDGYPNNGADYAVLARDINNGTDTGFSGVLFLSIANRAIGHGSFVKRNNASTMFGTMSFFESIAFSQPSNIANAFRIAADSGNVLAGTVYLYRLRK